MPKFISVGGEWKEVKVELNKTVQEPVQEPVSDAVTVEMEAVSDASYDLNQDGKVDEQDISLAAKVLNNAKKKRTKKSK